MRIHNLLLALCAFSPGAVAGTALLSWTAPTQYTDTTPIAPGTVITYRLSAGPRGAPKTVVATLNALSYAHTAPSDGTTYCYSLTADVAENESEPTPTPPAEVCKTFLAPVAPGNLRVVVQNTTAYRMRQSVDGFTMVPMGSVPADTECDPSLTVNGYSVVPRDAVTLTSRFDTKPLLAFAQCFAN